ncbi:hypothetical protein AGDE_07939 [Angomonas deanei]|nr:hypothetical protein AGDE_07939 [Angomonas deanei]|eukprot:EPY34392.1 hypothetical protein AGDE_07939 [Angomonas deanei]
MHSAPTRDETPTRGRRHYSQFDKHFKFGEEPPRRAVSARRYRGEDHLRSDMQPNCKEPPVVRGKRYIPEPSRARSAEPFGRTHSDSLLLSPVPDTPRPRTPHNEITRSHLSLSSLQPREEPVKKPQVPPPMILKPRTKGIRMFPEKRSPCADEIPRGVKKVAPPEHWKSVTEKQGDFLTFGVESHETPTLKYKNQSTVPLSGVAAIGVRDERQSWRGRSRECRPAERRFDIITGRPIPNRKS